MNAAIALETLPPPPADRAGWPWTEASAPVAPGGPDGASLPKISIITPSFNQAEFLEETIRSVLLQGYPNLEYCVIDGGSTDGSVEILQKYDKFLSYWVSERDRGQTDAINKGLARVTGEIVAYLNSDDYYLPGTFARVAAASQSNPEADLFHGRCRYVDRVGNKTGEQFARIDRFAEIIDLWGVWWQRRQFVQPEVFWTRRIAEQVGALREDLYFVMDYEYWCRILLAGGRVRPVDAEFTCFRLYAEQKSTSSEAVARELLQVVRPWLWDPATPIPAQLRQELQAKWLYQSYFLPQVAASAAAGEPVWQRWLKSAGVLARHPQILRNPVLRDRLGNWLSRRLRRPSDPNS